jgi:chemotaxis protein MotB
MAEETNVAPIIIKKKKGGGHGHHGGAWKVAYADFVTAMMAFFLLLWLLNATTEDQKKGIAEYFTPTSVSNSNAGQNGVLGGQTLAPGPLANQSGGMTVGIPVAPSADASEEPSDRADKTTAPEDADAPDPRKLTEEQFRKEQIKREDESFAKAENDLRQAIQDVPELRQLAQNLIIDRTPEGMRIQIVDQDKYSMFPLGSAALYEHTTKLMAMVVKVVERMPNKVSVTGHTDSTPYGGRTNYTNWELSTDRANASRRAMMESGLDPKRLSRVVGKADQEPLLADTPADPRNRRISIVLLRENQVTSTN